MTTFLMRRLILPAAAAAPIDSSGASLFTALREQLGLKLESACGPVEVLMIDGVSRLEVGG